MSFDYMQDYKIRAKDSEDALIKLKKRVTKTQQSKGLENPFIYISDPQLPKNDYY